MALTVLQYVGQMRTRQERLAKKLGVDIRSLPEEFTTILTCSNAMIGVCMRAMVLAGITTDAQLAAAFDDAVTQAFPPSPAAVFTDPALDP